MNFEKYGGTYKSSTRYGALLKEALRATLMLELPRAPMCHNELSAMSEGALSKDAEARIVSDEHGSSYLSRLSFNVPR